jgi:hypothetical protein
MNARLPLFAHLPVPDSEAVLARLFEVSPEPVTVTGLEGGCVNYGCKSRLVRGVPRMRGILHSRRASMP